MNTQLFSEALCPYIERNLLAGAVVAVGEREQTLALEAIGSANLASNVPMQPDSIFWIASITKPITATALMMLVDEGKICVDEAVSNFIPEFGDLKVQASQEEPPRPPKRPVLIRDLLSHTSGLPFSAPEEAASRDALSPAQGAIAYARLPLQFDPGTAYSYSNAGINTAARILEIVSGEDYAAFLTRRLLEPLGMRDTLFRPNPERLARLAKAYRTQTTDSAGIGLEEIRLEQLRYPLDDPSRHAMAAGGLFSTAHDLLRFGRMILRGGELDGHWFLSQESLRMMISRQTASGLVSYGFGWGIGPRGFGHGGALRTDLWIDIELGIVRVFLVQHDSDGMSDIVGQEILPGFARVAERLIATAAHR